MRGNASPVKYISRFHKKQPVLSVSFHIIWNHCVFFLNRLSKHSNPCLLNPCTIPIDTSYHSPPHLDNSELAHYTLIQHSICLLQVFTSLTSFTEPTSPGWESAGCPHYSRNLWKAWFKQTITTNNSSSLELISWRSDTELTQKYFSPGIRLAHAFLLCSPHLCSLFPKCYFLLKKHEVFSSSYFCSLCLCSKHQITEIEYQSTSFNELWGKIMLMRALHPT